MAINAGEVYFSAYLKLQQASADAEAFKKKYNKLIIDAEFKNLNSASFQKQVQAATKAASASAKVQAEIEVNKQELRNQVAEAVKTAESAANITANVEVNKQKFKNSISSLSVFTGNTLSKAFTSAADAGAKAVTSAFSVSSGAVLGSLSAFSKIEGTLNQIAAKSSLTGEQFDSLKEKIRQVSATSVTSPKQLTGLADVLSTAGFAAESIEKLLKPLGVAEIALKRSAANLASDVAIIKDAFTLDTDQQSQIANFISSTVTAANLDANTLANSTRYFRSQLQGLEGLQATNEAILLASLAGFRGSTAGTGLQQVFAQGLKKQEEVSERLGVSLVDTAGNIRNESEVLQEIARALARVREESGSGVASALGTELFGIRGNRIANALSKVDTSSIDEALEKSRRAIEGVDVLGELANKTLEGVSGSLIRLNSQAESFGFSLANALAPGTSALLTGLSQIFEAVTSNQALFDSLAAAGERLSVALRSEVVIAALQKIGQLLSGALQGTLDAIANQVTMIAGYIEKNPEVLVEIAQKALAIANAFSFLGQVVSTSFGVLIGVLTSFFEGFSAGLGSAKADTNSLIVIIETLGTVIGLLARPIGYVAGLITNLLLQITSVGTTLRNAFDNISTGEDNPFSGIVNAISGLQEQFTSVITKTEFFSRLGQQLRVVFDGVISGLQTGVNAFLTNSSPGIEAFISGLTDALPGITALVERVVGWIVNAMPTFQALMNTVGLILGNSINLLGVILGNLARVGGWLAQVIADNQALDLAIRGIQGTATAIFNIIGSISNSITGVQAAIYNLIIPAVGGLVAVIGTIGNTITSAILAPFQLVYDLIFGTKTLADLFVAQTLSAWGDRAEELGAQARAEIDAFVSSASTAWNNLTSSIATKWTEITSGISDWFSNNLLPIFTNIIPNALSSFWASELQKWENTKALIQNGLNGFLSFFTETLPNATASAWANISTGFGSVTSNITEWIGSQLLPVFTVQIPTAFANLIADINNRILELGTSIGKWFDNNVLRFINDVIPSAISTFITSTYAKIEELKTNITNWIGGTLIPYFTDRLPVIFSDFIGAAIARFLQLTQQVTEFFNQVQTWVDSTIREYVNNLVTFALEQLLRVREFVTDLFTRATSLITQTIPENVSTLISFATEQVTRIWEFITGRFNAATSYLTETLVENVRALISFASEQANNIWNTILGIFNIIKDWITVQFIQQVTQLKQFATEKIAEVNARATAFYDKIKQWITEAIVAHVRQLTEFVQSKIQEVWNRVQEFFGQIQTFITETLPGYVTAFFTDATTKITDLGKSITDTVKAPLDEIGKVFSGITESSKAIGDNISGWAGNVRNFIGEFGSNVWNNLLGAFGGGTPGQGNASDLLAFLGGDLTAQEFLSRNSFFGSSGGINDAAAKALAQRYFGSPREGSNEGIFEAAGISKAIIDLIKSAEGFYSQPYFDSNLVDIYNLRGFGSNARGGYSSGFGTYARSLSENLSVEEANRRLLAEVQKAEREVRSLASNYGYKFNENQINSLISLAYNGGIGMIQQLTNYGKRSIQEISNAIPLYNKSGNRELLGLTRRREVEKALFDAAPVASNTIINQVGNGLYDSYLTGLIPGQKYGAPRSGGLRRHAGTDFDIQDRGGTFESFIGGRVVRTGYDAGGYYRWYDIRNDALGMVERIAELDEFFIKVGDLVKPGQLVGRSSTDTGVVHVEYRPIQGYEAQPFGYSGTIDPVKYLTDTLGLFTLNGTRFTPVGGTATTRTGDPGQFGGISDNLLRASNIAREVLQDSSFTADQLDKLTQQVLKALNEQQSVDRKPLTMRDSPDNQVHFHSTATAKIIDIISGIYSHLTGNANAVAPAQALLPTTSSGSTTTGNVFAQLNEGVLVIGDRVSSIVNFTTKAGTYLPMIAEYLFQLERLIGGTLQIALAPNNDENFTLQNTLRQILTSNKASGTDLNQFLASTENQQTTTTGTSQSQSQSVNNQQYTFSEAINRIAEYAQMIYDWLGTRNLDSLSGTSEAVALTERGSNSLAVGLEKVVNKLSEMLDFFVGKYNAFVDLLGNTIANSIEIGSKTNYYKQEGFTDVQAPMLAAIESLFGATSLALKDSDYSNLLANIPEGFTITLYTKPLSNITTSTARDLNLNVTTHLVRLNNGQEVEMLTKAELDRSLQELKRKITEERHEDMTDPAYTSEISISALESLRRDIGLRSVILG